MDSENVKYLEINATVDRHHNGHITKMAVNWFQPNLLVTASHDKNLIIWHLEYDSHGRFKSARQKKLLSGHGHYVSDVVLSEDAKYALSASYDKTLRLWDLETGICTRKFLSHTNEVTCVTFSNDYRLIISGSRDRTIKIWNTLGECKATLGTNKGEGHIDWVSSVKFTNFNGSPAIVSTGWDSNIKLWSLDYCSLLSTRKANTGPIVTGALTPDSSLTVAAGKNGNISMIETEDLADIQSTPLTFADNESVVAIAFSPSRFWLAVAYHNSVKLWSLDSKKVLQTMEIPVDEPGKHPRNLKFTAIEWLSDGDNLITSCDDNSIRVWSVTDEVKQMGQ